MSDQEKYSQLTKRTSDDNTGFDFGETRLVKGAKEIESLAYAFIERATKSSYLAGMADDKLPADTKAGIEYTRQIFKQNPNLELRVIADVQKANFAYYRELMNAGVELRHIEGNKVSFAISKDEYIATPLTAPAEQIDPGAGVSREVVWSTRKDVVSQAAQIFQAMWHTAIRGEVRIKQLEEGTEPEVTLVLQEMDEVYKLGKKMNDECEQEALMILASGKTISRNRELFGSLAERQNKLGFDIRILAPFIDDAAVTEILPNSTWRRLEQPVNVSIIIYDRRRMFITQYLDAEARSTEKAVSTNIYSTSRGTIAGIISIFEALWGEAALREMEQRSRKQAQLLQDILTHDIRNYVQVSKSSAEILREQLNGQALPMLDSIEKAADSTSKLIERTKKLAKIVSQSVELRQMNLRDSIERSVRLIIEANRTKRILVAYSPPELNLDKTPVVQADELLDEVFTNILANSVQYTKGYEVPIEIGLAEVSDSERNVKLGPDKASSDGSGFWKVTISDHGKGIHDDVKKKAFTRYQNTSTGSGLGLSIVHALVTRYRGTVRIDDRVRGEYSRGASIEVLLPREAN